MSVFRRGIFKRMVEITAESDEIRVIREGYRKAGPWITLGFGLVLLELAVG